MQLVHYDRLESTQLEAASFIQQHNPSDMVVITATEQTQGKGRFDRVWESLEGNFHGSFIVPVRRQEILAFYPFLAALAVADALPETIEPGLKWPNDVLVAGKKIAGILCQSLIQGAQRYVIIGVGVNIIHSPALTNYEATDIKTYDNTVDAAQQSARIIEAMQQRLEWAEGATAQAICDAWRQRALFIGQKIKFNAGDADMQTGIMRGINQEGALLLETGQGIKDYIAGEIVSASVIGEEYVTDD